jgi:hypothetical protein
VNTVNSDGKQVNNQPPADFLTRAKFAELQGWNRSYITKLGNQGRLVLTPDGKQVDVRATLAKLSASSDPVKGYVADRHAADRMERDVGQHTRHDAPADDAPEGGGESGYWVSKARRESALADMAELELEARLKKLVDRAQVEAAVEALHRMLRDQLLGLPTQVAPELAAMDDPFQIELKLRGALRTLLDDLSKLTAQGLQEGGGSKH